MGKKDDLQRGDAESGYEINLWNFRDIVKMVRWGDAE